MNLLRLTGVRAVTALAVTALAVVALAGCATGSALERLDEAAATLHAWSVVFRGPDGNLFVIASGRSEPIRLTSDALPQRLSYPAYAWVGDRVVYVAHERSGDERSSSLYVVRPGSRPTRIWRDDAFAAFFLYPSPDGSRVGYLGGATGASGFRMDSVDLATRERLEHGVGQPYYSAWSPSGSQIVSHINGAGGRGAELRIADIEALPSAGRPADASRSPSAAYAAGLSLRPGPFQAPAYSPDGSRIAVVLRADEGAGIHFLDASGKDIGRLADTRGTVAMSFAPDGKSIAYIDGTSSPAGSVVGPLAIAGAANRRFSDAATAFFWSPDSQKLVFFEPYLSRSDGSPVLLYRVRLYSLIDRRVSTLATMRPATSFAEQIVPFFDQYARSYSVWSPDSRFIALNSLSRAGFEVIHLVDTDATVPRDVLRVRATDGADPAVLGLSPAEGVPSQPLVYGSTPFFAAM